MNLLRQMLRETKLGDENWDGFCTDLVDTGLQWAEVMQIDAHHVWIERMYSGWLVATLPSGRVEWKHHSVLYSGGLVHDSHICPALPLDQYVREVFREQFLHVEHIWEDQPFEHRVIQIWHNGYLLEEGMVRLTRAQEEVVRALKTLTLRTPQKTWFSPADISDERQKQIGKASGAYLRTTKNALGQLKKMVPAIAKNNAVGWALTQAGSVMAETQLKVTK